VSNINSFVSAMSVHKDHLKVAVNSNPSDISLKDFVLVKHIIKDLVDIHSSMLEILSDREIKESYAYEEL
jgi:hypothetical protein